MLVKKLPVDPYPHKLVVRSVRLHQEGLQIA